MAASDWRVEALILALKRRGNVPTSSESWTTTDFLALADDEMRTYLVPLLRRVSEEFCVTDYDVSLVSGQSEYRLPPRATGETLRDVQLDTGNGFYSVMRRSPESSVPAPDSSTPGEFYIRDDMVVLVPSPSTSSGTLRMRYFMRPNKLVASSRAWQVTAKPSSTQLTLAALDSSSNAATFFGSTATVDLVRSQPGFRHVLIDASASLSTNTATLTAAEVADVTVGDYFMTAEESCVPQVPAEAHPLLAQAVVCAYLRAASQPGLPEAEAKLARMETDFRSLVTPRTQAQPRYVINREGPGWAGGYYGNRWRVR